MCPVSSIELFLRFENGGNGGVGVPSNDLGYQFAHSGVAYLGYMARLGTDQEYKEYPMVMLYEPLIAGNTYYVSFYVSLADYACGIEKVGAYLSVDPPVVTDTWSIYVTPQVEANIGFVNDTMEWTLIEGCFTADGGERYMTFGNFYTYAESPIDPDCQTQTYSYYYLDDVTLVEETTINDVLDLGPAVVACDSHTIVSNITGGSLIWSTGETSTSITVHTSGTYSLTVSGSCDPDDNQIDAVEVTLITDQDSVNIEEEVVTFCNGDEYVISLDPTAGMYTWSDGSSGSEFVLTTPGVFQVTLDNGCGESTDEVEAVVLYPPPIPDLGADTILCPGQEIVFTFDPDAGDYIWQDGSQSSTYSISDPGSYSLTITNLCGSVEDDLEVMFVIPPEFELGDSPTNLCLGDTISISLDPLMGEYLWSDGSEEAAYEITDAGFYGVTVTNFCGVFSDGLMVFIIPPPTFELADEIMVCPAELPVLLSVQNPVNATDFNWNNGSQNPTTIADTAGTYSVVVSNDCFSVTEDITVTLEDNIPNVMLPPDQDLCPGDSVLLTADTTGTHVWQDGSTADSLWVTSSGMYTLTTTSVCGMASDTVVFTYAPLLNAPDLANFISKIRLKVYWIVLDKTGIISFLLHHICTTKETRVG